MDVDDIVPGVDEMDVSGAGPRVSKKVKGTGAGGHPQNRQHPVLFADPFSPSIKAKKIDNMRRECIRKMGQRNFDKVYKYLHSVRKRIGNIFSPIFLSFFAKNVWNKDRAYGERERERKKVFLPLLQAGRVSEKSLDVSMLIWIIKAEFWHR